MEQRGLKKHALLRDGNGGHFDASSGCLGLDGVEECGNGGFDVGERQRSLDTCISANRERLLLSDVLGTDLQSEGNTLYYGSK